MLFVRHRVADILQYLEVIISMDHADKILRYIANAKCPEVNIEKIRENNLYYSNRYTLPCFVSVTWKSFMPACKHVWIQFKIFKTSTFDKINFSIYVRNIVKLALLFGKKNDPN